MSNTISPRASKTSSISFANNEVAWRDVLRDFWRDFIGAIDETKDLQISEVIDALDALLAPHLFPPREDGSDPRVCPTCGNGRLSLKLSKFGAFIGCSNYPECRYTRPLSADSAGEFGGTKKLGEDPQTGLDVTVRSGRFGPYLQLGETVKDGEKPKRAGLPKGVAPDEIDLARALACSRCRAKSAASPKTASRSAPASAASDPTSSTARPTPISIPRKRSSPSGSTAR